MSYSRIVSSVELFPRPEVPPATTTSGQIGRSEAFINHTKYKNTVVDVNRPQTGECYW